MKQKIMGFGLSALFLTGCVGAAVAPARYFAGADPDAEEPTVAQSVQLTTENAELFLPESYEQYLPLESPTNMAMSEHYIAISDGTQLYVYDKEDGNYERFSMASETDQSTISKLQFTNDGNERLLFSRTSGRLYEFSCDDQTVTDFPEVPCSTFLTEQNYLYSISSTEGHNYLSRYPLDSLKKDSQETIRETQSSIVSKLSYADGILYCVRNDTHIVEYDVTGTPRQLSMSFLDKTGDQVSDLKFVCAYDDYLYYSVNGTDNPKNGLWRTDFNGNTECVMEGNGISAISTYRGELYCIREKSLLKLTVKENEVHESGYEIASSSTSENRLSNAVDAVRAGNLLVTADADAQRVSVYNFATGEYSVVPCDFTPTLVATDGDLIAVAEEKRVYTFRYGETELTLGASPVTTIKGIACVYGSVYFITSGMRGKVGDNRTAWLEGTLFNRLTCDLYGNLYVSDTNGNVYAYDEDNFLTENSGEKLDVTLPANHTVLRSDFEGNLYALAEDTVYKNGERFATVNGNDYVYHEGEEARNPSTFALGFEDSEVYFLFGNFVVRSKAGALDLPTLNRINATGVSDQTFSVHGSENLLVDIPDKTVGVLTDLTGLSAEDCVYFPYAGYYRLTEQKRGVILAETERYYLVLIGEQREGSGHKWYSANLFQKKELSPVPEEEYWQAESKTFYLSSAVNSYYVPCLDTTLAQTRLPRGARVTVTGYVTAPEYEYAQISYETEARTVQTGYVPKSYLTNISPIPAAGVTYEPVYLKANTDGVLFTSVDGEELLITDRTEAKAVRNDDGTYTVRIERDGKAYYAKMRDDQIERNSSDALRIALIVILSVLALVIIGAWVYLMPRPYREAKEKTGQKPQDKQNPPSEK